MDEEEKRISTQRCHRREIGERMIRRVLMQSWYSQYDGRRTKQERIAIRWRFDNAMGSAKKFFILSLPWQSYSPLLAPQPGQDWALLGIGRIPRVMAANGQERTLIGSE